MRHLTDSPSPPPMSAPSDAFRFGRNWQRYLTEYLTPERERIAAVSLAELVGDVRGRTFIDIGCGSGLFSLCAHRAGAREIVSVDVDPDSVAATRSLHAVAGAPANWRVLQGSILDPALLGELEPADVVYSWGVLHHTGAMYTAITNASTLVRPGGILAIAIYNNETRGFLTSERWSRIKRAYNHAPRVPQMAMEAAYGVLWLLRRARYRQNPLRVAREYRRSRGMALWTDLVDWLGGYPYEFATSGEIIEFCEGSCGLRRKKVISLEHGGTGNNEFVFERPLD